MSDHANRPRPYSCDSLTLATTRDGVIDPEKLRGLARLVLAWVRRPSAADHRERRDEAV